MDIRNFNVTDKIFNVLNDIKGFEVAQGNPTKGVLIVKYDGTTFCLNIIPIFKDNEIGKKAEDRPFEEIVKEYRYLFRQN